MNPDVTHNITSSMSELQLQFLQQLKIQPLQSHLAAPAYQHVLPDIAAGQVAEAVTVIESLAPAWQQADGSLPLVQDLLVCLQQYGAAAQWFYQAQTDEILLRDTGLYSAPPQHFFSAAQKKQLWQSLCAQLVTAVPTEIPADTDQTT